MTVTPIRPTGFSRHAQPGSPDAQPSAARDPRVSYEGNDLDRLAAEFQDASDEGNIGRLAILAVEHFPSLIDQARAALAVTAATPRVPAGSATAEPGRAEHGEHDA